MSETSLPWLAVLMSDTPRGLLLDVRCCHIHSKLFHVRVENMDHAGPKSTYFLQEYSTKGDEPLRDQCCATCRGQHCTYWQIFSLKSVANRSHKSKCTFCSMLALLACWPASVNWPAGLLTRCLAARLACCHAALMARWLRQLRLLLMPAAAAG